MDVALPEPAPRRPPKPGLTPPFWAGGDVPAWGRLLARNGFAVHRGRWVRAALVTAASVAQTALRFAQQAVHGHEIARAELRHAPVFVLGHWRSGTTLLHELLARDPRHAAPTTYDCFNPHHFVLTRSWLPGLLRRFAPARRPMDAMAAGWDRPQEDEFALALLGQPSPYERIAFPNRPAAGAAALDLSGLSPPTVRAWERAFARFISALTVAHCGRRLVFKSPPHTARIPVLLRLYPDARFIHLVRDPYTVYASTLNLWRVLFTAHGLQRPSWAGLPEYVLDTFARLHAAYTRGRGLIPSGRLYELRYEDLVRDPLGRLEAAYRGLGLGDFEPARRSVEEYLAGVRDHEAGTHVLTAEEYRAINSRWAAFFDQYGYPVRTG